MSSDFEIVVQKMPKIKDMYGFVFVICNVDSGSAKFVLAAKARRHGHVTKLSTEVLSKGGHAEVKLCVTAFWFSDLQAHKAGSKRIENL